jgi:hypothetical protein
MDAPLVAMLAGYQEQCVQIAMRFIDELAEDTLDAPALTEAPDTEIMLRDARSMIEKLQAQSAVATTRSRD